MFELQQSTGYQYNREESDLLFGSSERVKSFIWNNSRMHTGFSQNLLLTVSQKLFIQASFGQNQAVVTDTVLRRPTGNSQVHLVSLTGSQFAKIGSENIWNRKGGKMKKKKLMPIIFAVSKTTKGRIQSFQLCVYMSRYCKRVQKLQAPGRSND